MIGVFDSGLGGLSTLAAIADALPQANLTYLADTAHVPYGEKDDTFIRHRVLRIGQYLATQGCTLIVAATPERLQAELPALALHRLLPRLDGAARLANV